ncbi:MAG: Uma2 family endonuclease [Verrucomicrobiaceae bacterium]|nr:Uma2 family endonuclease [Verrucomicrobiaceae bacterium]
MITGEQTPEAFVGDEEEIPRPDVSNLITEDDTPVDNLFSEKQMRLLTESIHTSWKPGFPFVAMANVGVYVALNRPAIVPDVLVTTEVEPLQDAMKKDHRSYFTWMYGGKVPDVVIEIVSNTKGGELSTKKRDYHHIGVPWYAVFDPAHHLTENTLTIFERQRADYVTSNQPAFEGIGLGVTLWTGEYEGMTETWLRWTDRDGKMLLTGKESTEAEARRAAAETKRAAAEAGRAARFAAKLRELGVDPEGLR